MTNNNNKWEQRFSQDDYVYGEKPNEYFKTQLEKLSKGSLLLPAEGQGRNAVWAATQGWDVTAFDQAVAGRKKALQLALKHQVQIDFNISEANKYNSNQKFDVIALIYAHFGAGQRAAVYQRLLRFLKPGGKVIFEGFSKEQLQHKSGGPKDVAMLFSEKEVREEFPRLSFDYIAQEEIQLSEGDYHQGKGSVIRFVATKRTPVDYNERGYV